MTRNLLAMAMIIIPASSGYDIDSSRAYITGYEEGSQATVAAVNAQTCLKHYREAEKEPGPECYEFIKEFNKHHKKYNKIKEVVEKKKKKRRKKK